MRPLKLDDEDRPEWAVPMAMEAEPMDTPPPPPPQDGYVPPELRVDAQPAPRRDDDYRERIASAYERDRQAQAQADVREYLRAAFGRTNPQLRNVGTSYADEVRASQVKAVDPLERELMALRVHQARQSLEKNPLDDDAKRQQIATQRALEERYRRPPQPDAGDPLEGLKRDKLEAETDRIKADAEAKRRPKPVRPSRASSGSPNVPASIKLELSGYDAADEELAKLEDDFKRLNVGGGGLARVAARGSEALGLNNDYTEYIDAARRAMQGVGTILEKGKLAAGDELKYRKLLPEPGDSPQRMKAKIEGLRAYLKSLKTKGAAALGQSPANDADGKATGLSTGAAQRLTPGGKPYARKGYSASEDRTYWLGADGEPVEVANGKK